MTARYFRWVQIALWLAAALLLAYEFAMFSMQSHYSWYDDEGFMLMTLRQYVGGTPLYDRLYTEYGPFYYIFHGALFRITGWAFNHDGMRWWSVLSWVLVAVGWAVCVYIWRRSVLWSITALLATTVVLRALEREPGHPQTLILLCYALAFVAALLYTKLPNLLVFMAIGGATAAMLLTKINIGVFMCAALAAVFTASLHRQRKPWLLAAAVTAMCLALPALLMRRHFSDPEAVVQCAAYTFGIWATLDTLRRHAHPELDWSAVGWASVGFLGVALLTVLGVLLQGTSPMALINGVIIRPFEFGSAIPYQRHMSRTVVAAMSAVGGLCLLLYARARSHEDLLDYLQAPTAFTVTVRAIASPPLVHALAPGVMWMFIPRVEKTAGSSVRRVPM